MVRMQCPCCGYFTQLAYSENEPSFEICEVCFWQHDSLVNENPNAINGANHISLNEARDNYKKYGVCKKEFKHLVRQPLEEELPINNHNS